MSSRDGGQFVVEHTGEREQVVALVLKRYPYRADVLCIRRLTARQFLNDEVEQHLPRRQGRSGKRQNIVAQPLGERSDVARQPGYLGLDLPGNVQLGNQLVVWAVPAGAVDPGLQFLAS
jgi:hypothetical protein